MSKYTQGPWSINEWPQATTDIAIGAVGTPLIAKVPLRDVSINEQVANALLIAAAPDLLEALTRVVGFWDRLNFDGSAINDLHADARAAIVKATTPKVQRMPSDDTEGGAA